MVAGVLCIGIGLAHVFIGPDVAVPAGGNPTPTAESEDRFYGAIFVGYGIAWIWASLQDPLPAKLFVFLSAIMLLGGVGRVLAVAADGRPHQFFIGLAVVEYVFPVLVFFLIARRSRGTRT